MKAQPAVTKVEREKVHIGARGDITYLTLQQHYGDAKVLMSLMWEIWKEW